jgi:hypothetical protein
VNSSSLCIAIGTAKRQAQMAASRVSAAVLILVRFHPHLLFHNQSSSAQLLLFARGCGHACCRPHCMPIEWLSCWRLADFGFSVRHARAAQLTSFPFSTLTTSFTCRCRPCVAPSPLRWRRRPPTACKASASWLMTCSFEAVVLSPEFTHFLLHATAKACLHYPVRVHLWGT